MKHKAMQKMFIFISGSIFFLASCSTSIYEGRTDSITVQKKETSAKIMENQLDHIRKFGWKDTFELEGYHASICAYGDKGVTIKVFNSKQEFDWGIQVRSTPFETDDRNYEISFNTESNNSFDMAFNIQPYNSPNARGALFLTDQQVSIQKGGQLHKLSFQGDSKKNKYKSNNNSLLHFKIGMAPRGTKLKIFNIEINSAKHNLKW